MFKDFQLVAITKHGKQTRLLHISVLKDLQYEFKQTWEDHLDAFPDEKVEFDPGYKLEEDECFVMKKFNLPDWLSGISRENINNLDGLGDINQHEDKFSIKGIVGFAQDESGKELLLFQNFIPSHVINPGRFLFWERDTYKTNKSPGLTLENRLIAVYITEERKLMFSDFSKINKVIPLIIYYKEAWEPEIRQILQHQNLAPINIDKLAKDPSKLFRTQFAILRDSKVLDEYSVEDIEKSARECKFDIQIEEGKIIFPENKKDARKLLIFLNEGRYQGPITHKTYETNSKREAN